MPNRPTGPSVIPQPVTMTVQQGTFTITPSTSIVVQGDKDFALAADFLAARFCRCGWE